MKFFVNENVEKRIVDSLRDAGYDVCYAAEIKPRLDDETVLTIANNENRTIITNDKDFSELIYLQQKSSSGIILLRFQIEDINYKIDIVKKVIREIGEKIQQHFVVISENTVRIRTLK